MKRLLLLALLLAAATTQAATVPQIKTAVDTFWTNNKAKFENRQADYKAIHGHYWQGIFTPSAIPDNGASLPADYTKHPTDHAETWADRFKNSYALASNLQAQIQVDVYDGPLGMGWTVTVRFTKDGVTYWRTWNYGPETWRELGWNK